MELEKLTQMRENEQKKQKRKREKVMGSSFFQHFAFYPTLGWSLMTEKFSKSRFGIKIVSNYKLLSYKFNKNKYKMKIY